ncbi:MAG TPA: type II toxin-antitoxin system RelE/ParE family toxin [Chthonomonadaceae bacterium]|nr:type II toxin-antitoxin system RelE/ParE family toxin [Chthonomonadaceae bacterium]
MSRYEISRRADADLSAIWHYIAQDSLEAADRQMDRFYEVFERLAAFPGLGRRRDEVSSGLRSLPLGNYVIYYRQRTKTTIRIVRVLHGAQRIRIR